MIRRATVLAQPRRRPVGGLVAGNPDGTADQPEPTACTTASGVAANASGSVRTAAAGTPSGRRRDSQPAAVSEARTAVTAVRTSSRRAARSDIVGKPSMPASAANNLQNPSWVMNSAR